MRLGIRLLQIRMWLNIDPRARAARRRFDAFQEQMEKDRIKHKALQYMAGASTTIIAQPVRDEMEAGNETVFERKVIVPTPTTVEQNGIEVQIYNPTDEDTADLMRRFELGDIAEHERMTIFGHQADTTPPEKIELEWDGDTPDPFANFKRL